MMSSDNLSKALADKIALETATTLLESLTRKEQISLLKPAIIKIIREHRIDYKVTQRINEIIGDMLIEELQTSEDLQRAMKEKAHMLAEMWLAVSFKEGARGLLNYIDKDSLERGLKEIIRDTKFLEVR